jgi:hypothetical protein
VQQLRVSESDRVVSDNLHMKMKHREYEYSILHISSDSFQTFDIPKLDKDQPFGSLHKRSMQHNLPRCQSSEVDYSGRVSWHGKQENIPFPRKS